VVNVAAVYVGGPKFVLSLETGYPDKCLWFFTQPFKIYWVSTSDAFLDMSFTSFSFHYSAILSRMTVFILKLWKTLLNKLYTNVITDLLVESFSLNSNAQAL